MVLLVYIVSERFPIAELSPIPWRATRTRASPTRVKNPEAVSHSIVSVDGILSSTSLGTPGAITMGYKTKNVAALKTKY